MAEHGETFVLDMGRPVRITTLVENYAAHAGVTNFEVRYTGLRPGEKLNETLFASAETRTRTAHPRISATLGGDLPSNFSSRLDELLGTAALDDAPRVLDLLGALVPGYVAPKQPATALAGIFDSYYPDDF